MRQPMSWRCRGASTRASHGSNRAKPTRPRTNGFAFHNWWHLALFYLDGAHYDKVLELYDRAVHPEPSQILLSLVDASALLWRLRLEGVDVGKRYDVIADEWAAQLEAEAGFYAFNDFHAAMSFAACGRTDAFSTVKSAMTRAAGASDAAAGMAREVGIPLVEGVEAFARSDYMRAIEHMEPVRDIAHRFACPSHRVRSLHAIADRRDA